MEAATGYALRTHGRSVPPDLDAATLVTPQFPLQ